MTSINIIALNKKFAFMRWSFLGAFCPKYLDILFQSVFSLNRMCTELAWDTRAGDDHISLHDEPNDDLTLLVGMIRLDQLFNLY